MKKTVIAVLFLFLCGCGLNSTPEHTVEGYLAALKNNNFDLAYQLLSSQDRDSLSYEQFLRKYKYDNKIRALILSKISFKITDVTVDGGHASVIAAVTRPDADKLLGRVIADAFRQAMNNGEKSDMKKDFVSGLNSKEMSYSTVDWRYRLINENGEWKIDFSLKETK